MDISKQAFKWDRLHTFYASQYLLLHTKCSLLDCCRRIHIVFIHGYKLTYNISQKLESKQLLTTMSFSRFYTSGLTNIYEKTSNSLHFMRFTRHSYLKPENTYLFRQTGIYNMDTMTRTKTYKVIQVKNCKNCSIKLCLYATKITRKVFK